MFCDEVLDSIEPIAAGELTPDGRIAAHLASCGNCAASLAAARRVDQLLRGRAAPKPGTQFTARTMAALRRQRWRSEQVLDAGFNLALAVIVVATIAAVWMLMRRSGLTAVGGGALDLFGAGFTALTGRVAPSLPLYGAAIAVLAGVIALWWWTERDAAA